MTVSSIAGTIGVNDESLVHNYPDDLRVAVLGSLIHEFVHFVSEFTDEEDESGTVRIVGIGIQEDIAFREPASSEGSFTRQFQIINEAITEQLAEEVAREFAQAIGYASTRELDAYFGSKYSIQPGDDKIKPFAVFLSLLKALEAHIAQELGVEERIVINALRHAMLTGEIISAPAEPVEAEGAPDDDEVPMLEEVMTKDFTARSATMELSGESIGDFINTYNLGPLVGVLKEIASKQVPTDARLQEE